MGLAGADQEEKPSPLHWECEEFLSPTKKEGARSLFSQAPEGAKLFTKTAAWRGPRAPGGLGNWVGFLGLGLTLGRGGTKKVNQWGGGCMDT